MNGVETDGLLQLDLVDGAGEEGAEPRVGGGQVQRLREVAGLEDDDPASLA